MFTKHGMYGTPTYWSWSSMKQRCYNTKASGYEYYGGAGIQVCERWKVDFKNFLADMGERPEGTTLDRIDSSKDYEPGNCRWADHTTQRVNQKTRNSTSGYAGVRQKGNRWEAATKIDYKYHFIGMFATAKEAHQAYLDYRTKQTSDRVEVVVK
jgi:hypothetical protein